MELEKVGKFIEKGHNFLDKISAHYILRKRMMEMKVTIEQVLYIDLQAAVPVGVCLRCGSEIYREDGSCFRCEAMGYDPA